MSIYIALVLFDYCMVNIPIKITYKSRRQGCSECFSIAALAITRWVWMQNSASHAGRVTSVTSRFAEELNELWTKNRFNGSLPKNSSARTPTIS